MLTNHSEENLQEELEALRHRVKELEESEAKLYEFKAKLQAREILLQSILNHSPNVTLIKDVNSKYVLTNRLFEQLLNLESGWIKGKSDYDIFPKEVADNCLVMDQTVLEAGKAVAYEMQLSQEDGIHTYYENKFPLYDQDGVIYGIGAISTDVTELKKAYEDLRKKDIELRQSQKMEALGRLAGGIAHDFNNLLTVMLGYTDLTLLELSENDRISENLLGIKGQVERATVLTRQLLKFSRQQVLSATTLNLNEVVNNTEKLLRRVLRENIELALNLEPKLSNVKADHGQLEQIIINLAVNARDAMPEGGKLIFETRNVKFLTKYANQSSELLGDYCMLTVSDTGCGIANSIKSKIFEPFFTTKEQGLGTGLGLATVYSLVKQNSGSIEVYSEVGKGTTFVIYLPCVYQEVETVLPPLPPSVAVKGCETILLVEDEAGIRGFVCQILRQAGFQVLMAERPSAAFQISDTWLAPIDLVLTDVIMPEMSGPKMIERIRLQRPHVEAIYMSGYTENAISHQFNLSDKNVLLQKPFTAENLLTKIRQVLDAISLQLR